MMRKKPVFMVSVCFLAALVLAGLMVARRFQPRSFVPAGPVTGVESLDESVLDLLQEICDPKASQEENMGTVYDWLCAEIKYRPGTADTGGGFTDALVNELAEETLNKRKGNCDGEAALTAVLLRRLGCEAVIVTGQFRREDGVWVDHAWTAAGLPDGNVYHFDPLYGSTFAGNPRDFFMRDSEGMKDTHRFETVSFNTGS